MKRIGLVVAYDGTNYCGWQTQPNGITVQGVLNETLSELLGETINISTPPYKVLLSALVRISMYIFTLLFFHNLRHKSTKLFVVLVLCRLGSLSP